MRWGLSPVFIYECLANSRRWQTYAIRSIGVAVLLASIGTIASSQTYRYNPSHAWRDYAALGQSYFYAIIGVELTLVMLAAPAATAGAICVDRARGTLAHMLVTELSDPEIVLGKLAARLLPILALVACTWPVLSICSLLGGIDNTALTLAFAIILAVALLGCSLALALSVWARKPHEVILVTYTFWMLVLLIWPIWFALSTGGVVGAPPPWTLVADPYYLAFAPYTVPGRMDFWNYFAFFASTLAASLVLIVLAVWRMRPVASLGNVDDRKGQDFGLLARLTRWLPGPSLDRNPVLWRKWHRSRPSRWLLTLIILIGGATGIACIVGAVSIWAGGLDLTRRSAAPIVGLFACLIQLIFGLLMLSAVSPTSMSEERQRGSLDLLATTALSTPAIVIGKWLGVLRFVPFLALGPGLVGLSMATAYKPPRTVPLPPGMMPEYYESLPRGDVIFGAALLVATILVHGALIASLGLAMATWIKRQSRAIAISVIAAVMLSAGWPIFLGVLRMGMVGQGLMNLSPFMATMNLIDVLSQQQVHFKDQLWWVTFWDLEVLVMALGVLWLTVRTFDGCFGRIPERPRRTGILSDIVVILAALIGVGGLFGSIAMWTNRYWGHQFLQNFAITTSALLVTIGVALVSAMAASSIKRGGTSSASALAPAVDRPDRELFASRWWESFRLVPLLAIGPALIAFTLATAPSPINVSREQKSLPGGVTENIYTAPSGRIYVYTTAASGGAAQFRYATAEEIAAATPARPPRSLVRLTPVVALVVGTILVHGAAFISLGLALGIGIRGRGRAIAACTCVILIVTVAWPILYVTIWAGPVYPWHLTMASLLVAVSALMINMHHEAIVSETVTWAASWDLFYILLVVVVSALAMWILDRSVGKGYRGSRSWCPNDGSPTPDSAGARAGRRPRPIDPINPHRSSGIEAGLPYRSIFFDVGT